MDQLVLLLIYIFLLSDYISYTWDDILRVPCSYMTYMMFVSGQESDMEAYVRYSKPQTWTQLAALKRAERRREGFLRLNNAWQLLSS